MTFLVLEESNTTRPLLCYLLLSLGIKGVPVTSRAEAQKELQTGKNIDGFLVDIDNRAAGGRELLKDLKDDPGTRDLPVIVHTVQTQKEAIASLAGTGVTGVLTKPFEEAESFAKLQSLLAQIERPQDNQRRHARVKPAADEMLRVNFRVSGHAGLLSGKVRNISMGGLGLEMITPAAGDVCRPDTFIEKLTFTLLGRQLGPSGTIVVVQGNIVGVRFAALSPDDSVNLARYIFDKISSPPSS
jgi:CheY-like chemotaxis protein